MRSLVIQSAAELRAVTPVRPLIASPASFEGSLEELCARWILPNLPGPDSVVAFHCGLVEYLNEPDALHLLRCGRGMERRFVYRTRVGVRIRATDNSPAWWTHYALWQDVRIVPGAFGNVVATMPAHIFDVPRALPTHASAAGWHIAHIFGVKDGRTDFEAWSRREVVARFVRNVHPCNYFLVPKPDWTRWGGDERVIGYFAALFAERYAGVWREFLELARADEGRLARTSGPIAYSYRNASGDQAPRNRVARTDVESRGTSYRATRLTFKRDVIEPLGDDERFRVETPEGTFEMTKAEFHRAFPGVVRSASYREGGVYHYPKVPRVALEFRLDE